MEGEGTGEGTKTGDGTGTVPAWTAQLPADLKDNPAFTAHKTLGDLAKAHLEVTGKVKEIDGLKTKLDNSIPKLAADSTDEEKAIYYQSLGRPEKADGYEFEGDKLDPKTVAWAKDAFYRAGLSKDQAKAISGSFNGFVKGLVDADAEQREKERGEAETKLKGELGDKYDGTVEMIRRFWKKHTTTELDAFVNETKIGNHPVFIRFMAAIAKATGEDISPAGSPVTGNTKPGWISYDKSPAPPGSR